MLQYFIILFLLLLLIYLGSTSKKKDISGQVALVTGAANGIGKEIAFKLVEQGCKVAIADIDITNAQRTVNQIILNYHTADIKAYKVDVSCLADIEQLRLDVIADLGAVDILINNAGIIFVGPIDTESPKALERMLQVNVMSLVWTTRVFLDDMIRKKRGHIASISSMSGLVGALDFRMYSTTKFAVRGFMEALHTDLVMDGHSDYIQTTTVYPSFINSRQEVIDFTEKHFKSMFIFDTKTSAKRIVDGILSNERVVTIPGILYLIGYMIQIPVPIYTFVLKWLVTLKR